ncbi:MAG: ATP-dependent RecD-like DNA helicase, partial [Deltaproteobacteria bacterium]
TLTGLVDRIVYENEATNWVVARFRLEDDQIVTVVGPLRYVRAGETLRVTGAWVENPKYGLQFRIEHFVPVEPATAPAIEKYLASGLIPGIGPKLAKRIVGRFGEGTLEVIEREPERLAEVPGIREKRIEQIREAWEKQREIKEVMLFLQGHGVSANLAAKIYDRYGNAAVSILKSNPFRLARDLFGVGFKTADRIAENLGIAKTAPERAAAGTLHILSESVGEGHLYLPRTVLLERAAALLEIPPEVIDPAIDDLALAGQIVVEPLPDGGAGVYLRYLHEAERRAAQGVIRLLRHPPRPIPCDIDRAIEAYEKSQRIVLAAAQRKAVALALREKATIVTGGPGTGKTTIIRAFLEIFQAAAFAVMLAAPTGRAAKRLKEATGIEARTIHRLLEFSPQERRFLRGRDNPLALDLLVLDEVSMVDLPLFAAVVEALPEHARLVLVGDADQLPSVGPGNVLRDLIESGIIPVVRLTEIFRQNRESLITENARLVNEGRMPKRPDRSEPLSDFYFIEREDPEEVLRLILDLVGERLPRRFHLDPIDDIQVLAPMHRGIIGTDNLNRALQERLNPPAPGWKAERTRGTRIFRTGDKVMQIRNNYEKGVFNGDIGRISRIGSDTVEVAFDEARVTYETTELDDLCHAFCVSIHKSQGSEYPCVLVPLLTQHYMMLARNLLYTAITRGKRLVVLVGAIKALRMAIRNNRIEKRYTLLCRRLEGGISPPS